MPDPISPTAASTVAVITTGAAMPALHAASAVAPQIFVFGMAIGLRADVLLAGFCGSLATMAFFNTVPSTGDTLRELLSTNTRRMFIALGSSVTSGYLTPLMMLMEGQSFKVHDSLMLSFAFVAGAGAQQFLARFIGRGNKQAEAFNQAAVPEGGGDA